mmetsp:Transcript_6974/g.16644  ORF Transcript_6974/g.16644 Transcript_6974/m.16644 type:complete len:130 (-) Transcript_6974:397-786(-)
MPTLQGTAWPTQMKTQLNARSSWQPRANGAVNRAEDQGSEIDPQIQNSSLGAAEFDHSSAKTACWLQAPASSCAVLKPLTWVWHEECRSGTWQAPFSCKSWANTTSNSDPPRSQLFLVARPLTRMLAWL